MNGQNFKNQSFDSEAHRGHAGKLSDDQLKERAQLHALRLTNGKPTIQEIADHWMSKYGIQMSYAAEKEWCSRNERLVHDTIGMLVAENKIDFAPFTEANLLVTLKYAGSETGKIVKRLETQIKQLLVTIDPTFDAMKQAGIKFEELEAMEPPAKVKARARIKYEKERNDAQVSLLKALVSMVTDQKSLLLDTVKKANDMYQASEYRSKQLDRRVQKVVDEAIAKTDQKDLDDQNGIEITDELRERMGLGGYKAKDSDGG